MILTTCSKQNTFPYEYNSITN
uniref:Uncharacterized protein n=1 Tax=Arundo donax TaxID=35708 RepID=A0A0A9TU67_ARUDO